MAVIAVAGGTGNVGRSIVDAIVATGKHEVKILSRKPNPDLEAEIGVPILAVDYSDVDAIVKVLEGNNIDTVISGMATHSPDGTAPHEIELIRAADLSKTTKRLISSEWGAPFSPDKLKYGGAVSSVAHKLAAREELRKTTTLEHTVFYTGFFMDYWGLPAVESYLSRAPLVLWLDIPNRAAAIPGAGDTPNVFTHTADVARFVAASLDLPRWEPETYVFGDRVTWNEFLRWAEEATGTKFKVAHDSAEALEAGKPTELPGQLPLYQFMPKEALQGMIAAFGLWFDEGVFDLKPAGKFLNESFSEIKPLKVKEMLGKAWKTT